MSEARENLRKCLKDEIEPNDRGEAECPRPTCKPPRALALVHVIPGPVVGVPPSAAPLSRAPGVVLPGALSTFLPSTSYHMRPGKA